MPSDKYYFGGDDDSGYVEWSSAAMIGKGSFSIVYSARLKHVRSQCSTVEPAYLCRRQLFNLNISSVFDRSHTN